MTLKSYAKLNLYLEVLSKRKDSYHNIKTLFERISLCDKIILKPRQDKFISITCNIRGVPEDKTNLAYRAAQLLRDELAIERGVEIRIIKRIPVAAGLGGGSSNAASVLLGLNKLWKLKLSQNKLLSFAKKIGSDVPFFIYGAPFAKGSGRGEAVWPLAGLRQVRLWHILAVPKIKVSTPFIYKKWDDYSKLTRPKYSVNMLVSILRKKEPALLEGKLFNSLGAVTSKLYPQVSQLQERLRDLGLKNILMSGSGPALFAVSSSEKEALALGRRLRISDRGVEVFVVRTI